MSFPTPHEAFLRDFQDYFNLLERDFLEPKKLQDHLNNIQQLIQRDYSTLKSEDTKAMLSSDQKRTISDTIKKITNKEKASREKINWSNNFSNFLKEQISTK